MQHLPVPIFSTGKFSKLMEDYVNEHPDLQSLYNRPHRLESYPAQIAERSQHQVDRAVLTEVLLDQYSTFDLHHRFPSVLESINALGDKNTYTVTTGHQVCLFTGPLYFIYKIVNAIRLADELSEKTDSKVIPVFWMATEDHDFDEVNHVWYGDLKYTWNREAGDAVGRMSTDGIEEVIQELKNAIGVSPAAHELLSLFERCYRPGQTLAQATRELANALFGDRGLVVLDADDPRLKAKMIGYFQDDILQHTSSKHLSQASEILEEKYFTQVNGREINLFYLNNHMRYRLEVEKGVYTTVDGPYKWTAEEIVAELREFPERFSPNVILRPLYQEVILPNLAYIGGGGELAYWLQLKPVFDAHLVPFPILRLRNSAGFIRRKFVHKMDSLNLTVNDVCGPTFEQKRNYFRSQLNLNESVDQLKEQAEKLFEHMDELAQQIDPSLHGTAKAYKARQLHLIENFEKKALRAVQRRESDTSRMFDEIAGEVFPGGSLQERRDTWLSLTERYGDRVLEVLCDELDPFAHDFSWFLE